MLYCYYYTANDGLRYFTCEINHLAMTVVIVVAVLVGVLIGIGLAALIEELQKTGVPIPAWLPTEIANAPSADALDAEAKRMQAVKRKLDAETGLIHSQIANARAAAHRDDLKLKGKRS